ncbi:MAG TPA: hypothetical protein VM846_09500 [Vicinamibacterales bacterium]|nr:hypothetical protein [Vicinamibacterales bacterium]
MAVVAAPAPRSFVWNETFDATLLVAPLALGLLAAAVVTSNPALYAAVVLADLWFLGYHHVVSTYTRLGFSSRSLLRNRFLALDLLVVIVVATTALAFTAGAWVVATAFLYLQWFHYMRQGYGISRMYFRTTPEGQVAGARDLVANAVIYTVPVYAIAQRSLTLGDTFLAMPVKSFAPPQIVVSVLAGIAAVSVALWFGRMGYRVATDTADVRYEGFIFSHVAIFLVGYVFTADANVGWLAINVWHNLQYVLVVWMVNVKRYGGRVDSEEPLLSRISQPGRPLTYFACCMAITTVIYLALNEFTLLALGGGLAATLGIYMGINFHHYVVDALIWKRRPGPVKTEQHSSPVAA